MTEGQPFANSMAAGILACQRQCAMLDIQCYKIGPIMEDFIS